MLITKQYFPLVLSILLFVVVASAQTTEFTYQGSLKDGANVANGNYDFEFRLFAVDTGGTAIGTLQRLNVAVTNGIFSVKLDFGTQFTGANRWLEIAVKPAGGGGFQQLLPRVSVSSSPYSIRSLNAATADLYTGIALARAGDKAGARTALTSVVGPRAGVAQYWLLYLDQQR